MKKTPKNEPAWCSVFLKSFLAWLNDKHFKPSLELQNKKTTKPWKTLQWIILVEPIKSRSHFSPTSQFPIFFFGHKTENSRKKYKPEKKTRKHLTGMETKVSLSVSVGDISTGTWPNHYQKILTHRRTHIFTGGCYVILKQRKRQIFQPQCS